MIPDNFVHHVFENKYYENKGGVWGPAIVDDIHRYLKVIHDYDEEDRAAIIHVIRQKAEVQVAKNVAGSKAGVHLPSPDKFSACLMPADP